MKYTVSIIIEAPIEEVIAKYADRNNYKHWMRSLISIELIEGKSGAVGSKTRFTTRQGKRTMTMDSVVLENQLPKYCSDSYSAPGVYNVATNRFKSTPDGYTQITNEQEFKFETSFMKLMAWLMPGMFKKQSMVFMRDLKCFIEEGTSVLDAS